MIQAQDARVPSAGRSRRWLGRVIPVVLVLGGAGLVGVIAWMPANTPPTTPVEVPPVNVKVLRVQPLPELADSFELTAIVEAERVVKVAAEVAGRIERWGQRAGDVTWHGRILRRGATLAEGEPISAGEPLIQLNKDLLQARFDRSKAQYEYDEREYRRTLDLYERGNTSKTELDNAGTRRDVSKAALDEAARELERTTIAAPIDGILNRMAMEVGEYASPGDCVAEIVDIATVKIVADVPERDVPYLKVGDPAEITRPNPTASAPRGEITYINALADEGTRTVRIEVTANNRAGLFRSGQIVRARLTRRVLHDVLMIPLASVIPLEEGKMVYVVNGGQAERRDVELGFIKGRNVRVLRGLAAGDRLIVEGHRYVGADQPVNVVEEQ